MNRDGCSAQKVGNSTIDRGERRNGGAVRVERSPLNVATDWGGEVVNTYQGK